MVIYLILISILPCILWWHVLDFSNKGQRFWAVDCHRKTQVILWYSLKKRQINNQSKELPNTRKTGTIKHQNKEEKSWVYVETTMYFWSAVQDISSGKTLKPYEIVSVSGPMTYIWSRSSFVIGLVYLEGICCMVADYMLKGSKRLHNYCY